MTGMRDHAFGCTCRLHTGRPWRRPEHWTPAELAYLERWYGSVDDERIAARLGRSVCGIRIRAKRAGIRKRDAGMSSREVAHIFGIDASVVAKVWIRRGLLRATRGAFRQGPYHIWLITEEAVEAFIRNHGQYVDVEKMPDSPYRDLADQHRFYSVPDVCQLTGRSQSALNLALVVGRYRAAKRGVRWYIPADELPRIALRAHLGPASLGRRQQVRRERMARLELRRNQRKGLAA